MPRAKYYHQGPKGRRCDCGQPAVRFTNSVPTCQGCIDKDKAIYATERVRGTCGFPGPPEPFRVHIAMA